MPTKPKREKRVSTYEQGIIAIQYGGVHQQLTKQRTPRGFDCECECKLMAGSITTRHTTSAELLKHRTTEASMFSASPAVTHSLENTRWSMLAVTQLVRDRCSMDRHAHMSMSLSTVPRRSCECVSEWECEWDRCSECRVWHMRTKEEDTGTWSIAQSIQ